MGKSVSNSSTRMVEVHPEAKSDASYIHSSINPADLPKYIRQTFLSGRCSSVATSQIRNS